MIAAAPWTGVVTLFTTVHHIKGTFMSIRPHLRFTEIILWSIAIALLASLLFTQMRRRVVIAASTPPPYTVIMRETVYDGHGNSKSGPEYLYAVRSDGSSVWRETQHPLARRDIRYVSGQTVIVNETTSSKSTTFDLNRNTSEGRDPNSQCLNTTSGKPFTSVGPQVVLGEEVLMGVRSIKIQFTTPTSTAT